VDGDEELSAVGVAALRDRTLQDRVVLADGPAGQQVLGVDGGL